MKLNYHDYIRSTKTRVEPSSIAPELYLARSAVGVHTDHDSMPIFGFAADPDPYKAEWKSQHELLEHMIFLPYAHDEESLIREPIYLTDNIKSPPDLSIKSFLIGASHSRGIFNANGCAISNHLQTAITHSGNELLERHVFCQIWYHRSLPLIPVTDFHFELVNQNIKLECYTTRALDNKKFAAVSLNCVETGFFAFGAAVRDDIGDGLLHAAGEAIMIYEDAYKGRQGMKELHPSQELILSLRNRKMSDARKAWLQQLIHCPPTENHEMEFAFETICFEPLPNIYAARSFAESALDPKQFQGVTDIPILPLF